MAVNIEEITVEITVDIDIDIDIDVEVEAGQAPDEVEQVEDGPLNHKTVEQAPDEALQGRDFAFDIIEVDGPATAGLLPPADEDAKIIDEGGEIRLTSIIEEINGLVGDEVDVWISPTDGSRPDRLDGRTVDVNLYFPLSTFPKTKLRHNDGLGCAGYGGDYEDTGRLRFVDVESVAMADEPHSVFVLRDVTMV